jgi:DNA-binding IclR family transcriptional regulator
MTERGELSKVTGLSRPDAGRGNHALVDEGFAERVEEGVYRLSDLDERLRRLGFEES